MITPLVTKLTYRFDRLRSIPAGILDGASNTFLLIIAVKAFEAGPTPKSFIAAAGNIGLLLSLWLVPLAERSRQPAMRIAAWLMIAGAISFFAAAALPTLPMLILAAVVGIGAANAIIPLTTSMYRDNYAPRERGKYVSRTFVVRIAATAIFGELAGRLLTEDISLFRLLLVAFGVASLFGAWCLWQIPSKSLIHISDSLVNKTSVDDTPPLPISPHGGEELRTGIKFNAFGAMRFLKTDRVLRWTLTSWMLMGFANLMMWPLRVEFLANPKYGLLLDPHEIAIYTILIPSVARLALSPLWGWLFDRMNFFVLRITLNVGFALGIAAFFTGSSTVGLIIGALIFGASNAGGEIAWNLWVTKFSPPEHVAEYMSVHTFFTGVRGIAAPLLAFQLTQTLDIAGIALVCAAFIVLASLILVPEIRGQQNALKQS